MYSDRWRETDEQPDPLPKRTLRLTGVFVAVVLAGLIGAWLFDSGSAEEATIGQPAPAFEVRGLEDGETFTLQEVVASSDGPIVLNLMASWCAPCREEIPELSAFADSRSDVTVVGVDVEDSFGDFTQFMADVQPTYLVGFDEGAMRANYQTLGLPATFILDSNGVIVDVFNGILDRRILEGLVDEVS